MTVNDLDRALGELVAGKPISIPVTIPLAVISNGRERISTGCLKGLVISSKTVFGITNLLRPEFRKR
jgi:hypothetical protein